MGSQKLVNILKIITENLSQQKISFALIGALALSYYGLPRYTSDIDILTEDHFWPNISNIMKKLGYNCYQKSKSFAQFDSEHGVYGKIDFMFVNTQDGKEILDKRINAKDNQLGEQYVIQPTDYIILKFMAIANNPDRAQQDEADIIALLESCHHHLVPDQFDPINTERILYFADRFGQKKRAEQYLKNIINTSSNNQTFHL